jgi:hypothetical protein
MMQSISSFAVVFAVLAAVANVQAEYKKLELTVTSSSGADILEADVTPMPILNPGEALLTFRANLKRPISKATLFCRSESTPLLFFFFSFLSDTIRTVLNIVRTVSGIALPVKCYKVEGVFVGSCDYTDLCVVLQTMLPTFKPETCPPGVAQYNIDCTCPFKIPVGPLNILKERMELPDAQNTMASFMASGDFSIRLQTYDAVGPYADITIKFTVKPVKPSG